jgi:hypothetical protein
MKKCCAPKGRSPKIWAWLLIIQSESTLQHFQSFRKALIAAIQNSQEHYSNSAKFLSSFQYFKTALKQKTTPFARVRREAW